MSRIGKAVLPVAVAAILLVWGALAFAQSRGPIARAC